MNYIKLYEQKIIEDKAEAQLLESVEQLDEIVLVTAIAVGLAAGVIFRTIDGIRGSKPKIGQYLKGIVKWAFSEYHDGSLSINDIRKAAYSVMREDQKLEDEFGSGVSKILSKKVLSGLNKGSKEFATILGKAIGRIAKRAGMSKEELNKVVKNPT